MTNRTDPPERRRAGPAGNPADRQQWTPVDAGREPLGRFTANFPVWVAAGVLLAGAIATLVAGSEWIALGFALVAAVLIAAARMNAGGAIGHGLEQQSAPRQFAYPAATLALVLAVVATIGVLVIVT